MYAAKARSLAICQLLFDNSADVNHQDKERRTALVFAIDNSDGSRLSSEASCVHICQFLIDKGAWVDYKCGNGNTALRKVFLYYGSDVNREDESDWTPLLYAIKAGSLQICQLLLDRGSDVNHASKKGYTPLFYAATAHSLPICQLLLDNGAVVNHADNEGLTTLMHAVKDGRFESCQLLLEKGASMNAVNTAGQSALDLALSAVRRKTSNMKVVSDTSGAGHLEACRLLLENGAEAAATVTNDTKPLNAFALLEAAARAPEEKKRKALTDLRDDMSKRLKSAEVQLEAEHRDRESERQEAAAREETDRKGAADALVRAEAAEAKLEVESKCREYERQEYQKAIDQAKKEAAEAIARAEAVAQERDRENRELKEMLEKERKRAEKLATVKICKRRGLLLQIELWQQEL